MSPGEAHRLDPELSDRLERLGEEGWEMWARFDREVRDHTWHSFVPADYARVLEALLPHRAPGKSFLEWGSGNGVITIMADLLGFDACGIELDPDLVEEAVGLAARHGSRARFVAGSFLPEGYEYRAKDGDNRLGTLGEGASGYLRLGRALDDFDVVYGYPWGGEEAVMHDLMRRYGSPGSVLLLHRVSGEVDAYRGGRRLSDGAPPGPDAGAPRLHR